MESLYEKAGSEHWLHSNIELSLNNSSNYLQLYTLKSAAFLGNSRQIHSIISTNYAKMKTHKRKPFLNEILWHYRKILVYILPLRVNIPKKLLKKEIMLITWCMAESMDLGTRRPNYSLWFFHATVANHWTALELIWKREIIPAWSTAWHWKDQTGCCMRKFFGIYKQGYKTTSPDWMARTHYIKESKSVIQRQRKDQMAPMDPSLLPSSCFSPFSSHLLAL